MQPINHKLYKNMRCLMPNPGNVIFTLLIVGITLWSQSAGAISLGTMMAQTTSNIIPYQGYLTDTNSKPLNGKYDIKFCLYENVANGASLWCEQWNGANAVQLDDGLFNVSLGSLSVISSDTTANEALFLGITIGTDNELTPRSRIYNGIDMNVPDRSITQQQAPFAPIVYWDGRWTDLQNVDKPIIYNGWFHGGADGEELHDLSDIFSRIDAVHVTKTTSGNNHNHVTFMVTNADGSSTATPSEIKISVMGIDGRVKPWIQGYITVIGQ